MNRLLALFFLCVAAWGQSTNATYEDWLNGNRTRASGSNYELCPSNGNLNDNKKWGVNCGGTSGAFNWMTPDYSHAGYELIDYRRPGTETPKNIEGITAHTSGFIEIKIFNNGYMVVDGVGPLSQIPVTISGVTTCTGGPADCGANGDALANGIDWTPTAMSGVTVTIPGHPFVNGEQVFMGTCIVGGFINSAGNRLYSVTNVTTNTFDLVGWSPGPCTNLGGSLVVRDNSRFYLNGKTFPGGTYSSQSGTIIRSAIGFDIISNVGGHAVHPDDWVGGSIVPGQTWNPNFNRMRFAVKCDTNLTLPHSTVGENGYNIGMYHRLPGDFCSGSAQGAHTYMYFTGDQFAGHTMYFEGMNTPDHTTQSQSFDNSQFMPDYYYTTNACAVPGHFWDMLTEFYLVTPLAQTVQPAAGGTCHIEPFSFALVNNQPDGQVRQVQASYSGTAYQVAWNSPAYTPGITYDMRYSTSGSMVTNGWSTGTTPVGGTGATVTGRNDGFQDVGPWASPNMGEATNFWVAIRPRIPIVAVTGNDSSGPYVLTPFGGQDFPTGTSVAISGVTNIPNGTYTITAKPFQRFQFSDSTMTQVVVSGSGSSQIATVTTAAPHSVRVGQVLQTTQSSSSVALEFGHTVVTSVPDNTHFSFNVGTLQTGSCCSSPANGTYTNSTDSVYAVTVWPSFSLDGTTSAGTATASVNTPAGGTVISNDDHVGFYEMNIPGSGPGVSPSVLPNGTVGTSYGTQTLTASSFAGTVTWSLLTGALPTGLSGCTSGTGTTCPIAGTPTVAGTYTFTIRATDGTSTVDTPYTVTISGGSPTSSPRGSRASSVRVSGVRQ